MTEPISSHPRRRFIGRAAAALAAFGVGLPSVTRAEDVLTTGGADSEHDAWMKPLKGKHRQFFHDLTAHDRAMLMATNYLEAYEGAFGAKPGEANAVIGVHGNALTLGFNDAAWAKYAMGKGASVVDPITKEPAVRNIFATGGRLTVDASQKRGIVFLMCDTALRLRAQSLVAERSETFEVIYQDLKASRLPGVLLVPAMVVAINRAQEAGFTYLRV